VKKKRNFQTPTLSAKNKYLKVNQFHVTARKTSLKYECEFSIAFQWFFYVQKTAGIPAVGGKSFFPAPWCRNFFEKKQFLKISRKTEDSMKLLSSETVRMMKIIKSYFSLKKNNKTNEFDIYQIRFDLYCI